MVGIVKTACNYSGSRYWFTCVRCRKRVGALYRYGTYGCQHCIGANYKSKLQQPQERLFGRLNALREHLGQHGGLVKGRKRSTKTPTITCKVNTANLSVDYQLLYRGKWTHFARGQRKTYENSKGSEMRLSELSDLIANLKLAREIVINYQNANSDAISNIY